LKRFFTINSAISYFNVIRETKKKKPEVRENEENRGKKTNSLPEVLVKVSRYE